MAADCWQRAAAYNLSAYIVFLWWWGRKGSEAEGSGGAGCGERGGGGILQGKKWTETYVSLAHAAEVLYRIDWSTPTPLPSSVFSVAEYSLAKRESSL